MDLVQNRNMYRYSVAVFFFLGMGLCLGQQMDDDPKKAVDIFFEGFHKRDSVLIKSVCSNELILQTIGRSKEGTPRHRTDSFPKFLKNIVSIPKEREIHEKLLDYLVRVDGPMAHVWTPYEFYVDGKFSHCGVNSFQLFHTGKQWEIIYLVDTRRRKDCTKE
ncbi:MAG: nuclear transport factor 2 family protein [Flavobacteriaceae bacterium]